MRAILHVDMDAFYASVEEQDRPELKGKPLIVGGTGGRGVVAAASYAVRRFGVRSAMPMREALRRCPEAICVHPRMARYKEVSDQVFAIFREFTPLVEGLSLDEAFLDVTSSQRLLGSAESIGGEIRRRIRACTGLTASVGIAPNKLLAKIASDLNKPDGMCRIGANSVRDILDGLPVEKLFGVGPKTLPAVHAAGIRSFRDLRLAGDEALWRAFGKHGKTMHDRACGLDDRPVEPNREEKSISAEETFATDIQGSARSGAPISPPTPASAPWDGPRKSRASCRPPLKRCSTNGWRPSPMPRCGSWGSGWAICRHRCKPTCSAAAPLTGRAWTRSLTASAADSVPIF
jgi:DNA polymerase-4